MSEKQETIDVGVIQRAVLESFRGELNASMLVTNQKREQGIEALQIIEWRSGRVNARIEVSPLGNKLEYRFSHGLCFGIFDVCEMLVLHPEFCGDLPLEGSEFLTIKEHEHKVRRRFADYRTIGLRNHRF